MAARSPRGLLGFLLYAGFWTTLLIPQIRRWRRRPWWNRIRTAVAAVAAGMAVTGFLWSRPGLVVAGAVFLLLALLLGALANPYALQETAARLGADFVLNGGTLSETPVTLFLTAEEILVMRAVGETALLERIPLPEVREIRIAGAPYRPSSVLLTKEPPIREKSVEGSGVVELELARASAEPLRLAYRGAFARHLAEVAAHTLAQALRMVSLAKPQKSLT